MFLQRIELQGFKSFAKKAIMEFPAPGKGCLTSPNVRSGRPHAPRGICGTTAIVGPNGSGKSNIVDAVRWVLGEQSLKLLRGKKATDVIFSGSSAKNQLGMAEVSLYLNNEDKSAPIDYSEVVITRRIFRDGNSEYQLNKNSVRLFDIVMLLAKTSFGQNTYSVIGQGMVDKIVNYSSQERKDFFDEATGVKQYQIRRNKSVNKLKKSRDNLVQASILVQELAPHLRSLTRQVNRLHRRQKIEIELRDLQIKYYGKKWLELDTAYQKMAVAFTGFDKKKIILSSQIEKIEKQLKELSQERGRAEEFNRLQNEYDRLSVKKNNLLQQLAEIKGKLDVEYLKIGKQDLTWLENRKDNLKNKIKELEDKIIEQEAGVNRFKKALDSKNQEQEKVLIKFNKLEEKLLASQKEFHSDLGVSEKEIRQAVNRIYSLQKDFIAKLKLTCDIDNLMKLKVEAEVVYSEVENFYNQIAQEDKKQQTVEMTALQEQLSDFLKTKDLLVNEINKIKIKLEVAVSQIKLLKVKRVELESDLNKVKGDLEKNKVDPQNQDKMSANLQAEKESLESQIVKIDKKIFSVKKEVNLFNEKEEQKKQKVFNFQQEVHKLQTELNEVMSLLNDTKVELAKIETKKEDLFILMRQDLGEDYRPQSVDTSDFNGFDLAETEKNMSKLKKQLEIIGGTDPAVEEEYNEIKERHDFLKNQSDDLEKAIKDLEKVVVELDQMIKKQFKLEFKKINKDFIRYFKQLFDGGNAQLVLSQKEITEAEEAREQVAEIEEGAKEPPTSQGSGIVDDGKEGEKIVHIEDRSFLVNMGIDIEACPPGKKIKNINMLSGGEKTMTALALVCAIIANNPSPFVLFDEVDAALDEANSAKFSNIIEELAHKTQFVIITHNRAIMARANVLYGVTMQGDGVSRLLSLKLGEVEKIEKYKV